MAAPLFPKPVAISEPQEEGQLGVFDAVNIIVGIVIGTTVFKAAPDIFAGSGSAWNALATWAIGGVLAFVGALCYAELATSYPRDGGDYVYLTKAFGPMFGFLFGWTQLTIVLTCSIGVMAVVFGEFASKLRFLDEFTKQIQFGDLSPTVIYAGGAILVITLLNLVGVVLGKWTQNLLSVLKIVGVLAIVVAGFMSADWSANGPGAWTTGIAPELRIPTPNFEIIIPPWERATIALILVMYAFGGWNDAAFVAAEVREPQRNIPRALLFGLGLITIVYMLVNTAYLVGLGYERAANQGLAEGADPLIPRVVMFNAFGDMGRDALTAIIMVSALGAVNGLIFTGGRVYATLGNDHRLFGFLGHFKPGRGAPILALLVQALIALSMLAAFGTKQGHDAVNVVLEHVSSLTNKIHGIEQGAAGAVDLTLNYAVDADKTFDKLFAISAPFFWVFFLGTGLSLFVLRDHKPKSERPFSVPLYPILPLIFCNVCAWMVYRAYLYVGVLGLTPVFWCFVGLVVIGIPLYFLSRMMGYRDSSA